MDGLVSAAAAPGRRPPADSLVSEAEREPRACLEEVRRILEHPRGSD